MGNCFGSEEAELEAVKNFGHHGQPQATARAGHPMAAPKHADASPSSGHRTSSSLTSGTTGSTQPAADAGAYPEGRILETPNLRIFTFAELRAATRNFKPDKVLGEGGFGRVYKGWVDEKTMNPVRSGTGMVVAVKKLNQESVQGLQEWQHLRLGMFAVGGELPWEAVAPEPGEAAGLLRGRQEAAAGVRVHGKRQPGESPLQKGRILRADIMEPPAPHCDWRGARPRLSPLVGEVSDIPRL